MMYNKKNKPVILAIDDDESVRELVCEVLTHTGFVVNGVGSSRCGYCQLRTSLILGRPFDLVVSDVIMPGKTGPAMLERVRADMGVDFGKKLFISGYSRKALLSRRLIGAEDEYLQKPFDAKVLVGKVRSMLGRVKMEEPGEI